MTVPKKTTVLAMMLVIAANALPDAHAQGPKRGRGPDADFPRDRDVFHFLLENHKKIQRKVTIRKDGVETVTESDDPKVAAKIREHVKAMYVRVDKNRPIRRRDPLFNELFRHTDKITMTIKDTKNGVKVTETSKDPKVVRLIQAHAQVVSLFVKKGFDEAHKTHPVPATKK